MYHSFPMVIMIGTGRLHGHAILRASAASLLIPDACNIKKSYYKDPAKRALDPCAGLLRGATSRFAPVGTPLRTPAALQRPPRTPATLRRFLATPNLARRSPIARTPGTMLSVGRGGLDSWIRKMGLSAAVGLLKTG